MALKIMKLTVFFVLSFEYFCHNKLKNHLKIILINLKEKNHKKIYSHTDKMKERIFPWNIYAQGLSKSLQNNKTNYIRHLPYTTIRYSIKIIFFGDI